MGSRSPTIDVAWTTGLQQALAAFNALVLDSRAAKAWSRPSVLPDYTVGGIAGHVLSLMVGFQRRLEEPEPDLEVVSYCDWYGFALSSNERHAGLVELGQDLARDGPVRLAADLDVIGQQLAPQLHRALADRVIPLASIPGAGVRLVDFLRTRFVELTVHADDIAVSCGLDTPDFPPIAWELAAAVISESTPREGQGAEFILAVSRPGRR